MPELIPVVLFAYARVSHVERTLASLKANRVPRIIAFSDGPRTGADAGNVERVRERLRAIDWCEVELHERPHNLGLGASILDGVGRVLREYDAIIVFEDDLECAPGTYDFMTSALRRYRNDAAVMSVTGWTHPGVTPRSATGTYFDGRAECWTWGTWARSWEGMEIGAKELMADCERRGIDIYRYGADLPHWADVEMARNLWAVRFAYLHLLRGGLCLRPAVSLVDHFGVEPDSTNQHDPTQWRNDVSVSRKAEPIAWPQEITENPECSSLWQAACGARPPADIQPGHRAVVGRLRARLQRLRTLARVAWRKALR